MRFQDSGVLEMGISFVQRKYQSNRSPEENGADVVVISIPYKWPKGSIKGHTHDPVDEMKLREWTGREPV